MAGNTSNLTFKLFGKDVSASRAFKHVGGSAGGLSGKFDRLGSSMSAVASGAAIAAGAAVAVGAALYDAAQAAAQDQKSSAALDKTLRNVTKATDAQVAAAEDWIDRTQRATGIADDDLRPALAQLTRATGDASRAQGLLNLALDISAGTGKDLQSVSVALGKAYDGNTAGLAKLGVSVKDTHGKTLSYSQIVDKLSAQFSGQAATAADTYDGKMARLGIAFDELKESIGYKVLPALEAFADWMSTTGEPAIERIVGALQEWLTPALDKAQKAFADIARTVRENQQLFDDLGQVAIPALKIGLGQFAFTLRIIATEFDKIAKAGSAVDQMIRRVAEAADDMRSRFAAALAAIKRLWNDSIGGLSLHIPGIPGTDLGNYDISIPRLAKGGIVTEPTLALIGEAGPEAVIPLRGRNAVGGTSLHIHGGTFVGTNPQAVGRWLNDAMRQAGGSGVARVRPA